MAIINVIEAERVEKPNGFVQYFIIKDKTMEPVLENIQKTINLEKSNNYDFFNFIFNQLLVKNFQIAFSLPFGS